MLIHQKLSKLFESLSCWYASPDPGKITAILNLAEKSTAHETKNYKVMWNNHNHLIPTLADIAIPIIENIN